MPRARGATRAVCGIASPGAAERVATFLIWQVVEDERIITSAREFKSSATELFSKLMQPLTLQFPTFFPPSIGELEFTRAMQARCRDIAEIASR